MIQPVLNNVLVKCFEGDEISEGGIFVPDSVKKDSNKVEVVAVGNGTKATPMKFKKGDIAFRTKDWGEEIWEGNQKYYLMNQASILAKL